MSKWKRSLFLVLGSLLLGLTTVSHALGPHECVLLINERSTNSVHIGQAYARLRSIPAQNVINLRIPAALTTTPSHMSRKEFSKYIWDPATRIIKKRGLDAHVLAWIYSVDFPIAVTTTPHLSIQGITLTRNRIPDLRLVNTGQMVSSLFSDNAQPNSRGHYSQSLDSLHSWLRDEMPLPSMMLGYTQERGNTAREILDCLERGAASDHTFPTGTVFFAQNTDVRSTCRQWQFPAAAAELKALGVKAEILNTFPIGRTDVLGLMIGAAGVNPSANKSYAPGAMAEHLTSAAAIFHDKHQTKLTAWIRAGCTASAGTVVEPFAYWTKFPHARFYVHYASGCTMLESFAQSIRCPMQILLVGDPLAAPWRPRGTVTIKGLDARTGSGPLGISADATSDAPVLYSRFMFLLDGRRVQFGRSKELELNVSKLDNGSHTIRVVAYSSGLIRHQAFAEKTFEIGKKR